LELVHTICVILFYTGTISNPAKHTAFMVISTMRRIPIGKSANVLVLKHVIARRVTKGGTKSVVSALGLRGRWKTPNL
jgi:hypothetical protein